MIDKEILKEMKEKGCCNTNFDVLVDVIQAILETEMRLALCESTINNLILENMRHRQSNKWLWDQNKTRKTNVDTGNQFCFDPSYQVWIRLVVCDSHELLQKFDSEVEARAYIDELTR